MKEIKDWFFSLHFSTQGDLIVMGVCLVAIPVAILVCEKPSPGVKGQSGKVAPSLIVRFDSVPRSQ